MHAPRFVGETWRQIDTPADRPGSAVPPHLLSCRAALCSKRGGFQGKEGGGAARAAGTAENGLTDMHGSQTTSITKCMEQLDGLPSSAGGPPTGVGRPVQRMFLSNLPRHFVGREGELWLPSAHA